MRSAACLVAVLAVLAEVQAYSVNRCPCPQPEQSSPKSPEVLQLLRKTGNAFKQVGDILLKNTASSAASGSTPQQSYPQQSYPQQSYPQQNYPQQSYPQHVYPQQGFPQQGYPQGSVVYYPVPFPPTGVPQAYPVPGVPAMPQYLPGVSYPTAPATVQQAADADFSSQVDLSDHLVSLASEYERAAQNECGCGNVDVNMHKGPSSLASGKASDIVVEVTLGDVTQGDVSQTAEREEHKKTVTIDSVVEASEGEEVEESSYTKTSSSSSSASIEEKTIEDTEVTNTVQVVEAIKLQPETSPLQVEVFDNTVAAVEKTIQDTVVVKSESEETKTIETSNGETVLTVKTYEETLPHTHADEECIAQGGEEETVEEVVQDTVQDNSGHIYTSNEGSAQGSETYQEKVEVVEVKEEKLVELKKEASVMSEMVETVDLEQGQAAFSSQQGSNDVQITVVDVEDKTTQTDDAQYEYEYEDSDDGDSLDDDVQDLQQYFPAAPKHVSAAEEKKYALKEGEHIVAERPRPVENVQVVVEGSSGQSYAEGLHTHTASKTTTTTTTTSGQSGVFRPHAHGTLHHHQAAQPVQRPVAAVPYEVPCEAHYGLPKPAYQQQQSYSAPQQSYSSQTAFAASQPEAECECEEEDDTEESYSAPEPVYSAPEPVYSAPEPVYSAPETVYAAPQPVYSVAKPVFAVHKQVFSAPQQPQVTTYHQSTTRTSSVQSQPQFQPQYQPQYQAVYSAPQAVPAAPHHHHHHHAQQNVAQHSTAASYSQYPQSQPLSYEAQYVVTEAKPATKQTNTVTYSQPQSGYAPSQPSHQQSQQRSYSTITKQETTVTKPVVSTSRVTVQQPAQQQQQASWTVQTAPQKAPEHTPAQYPPYYFTAHSNSIYSPALAKPQTPVNAKPHTVVIQPRPAHMSFKPHLNIVKPQPATAQPQVVVSEAQPAVSAQPHVVIQPRPAHMSFKPHLNIVKPQPAPAQPQVVVSKPQPVDAKPHTVVIQPRPAHMSFKPHLSIVKSQPQPAQPQVVAQPSSNNAQTVTYATSYSSPLEQQDSSEVVPQRYASEITYTKPQQHHKIAVSSGPAKSFSSGPSKSFSSVQQTYVAPVEVETSAESVPVQTFVSSGPAKSFSSFQTYSSPVEESVESVPVQTFVSSGPSRSFSSAQQTYSVPVEDDEETAPAPSFSQKIVFDKPVVVSTSSGGASAAAGPTRIDLMSTVGKSEASDFSFPAAFEKRPVEVVEASGPSAWVSSGLDNAQATWTAESDE